MSKMSVDNQKLMLAGLYLSKFNREGLAALGFKTLGEAYNAFAFAVGGKPTSVKLYMQEFDPYFPNSRIGWKNKVIRPSRQAFINQYGGLNLQEFLEVMRTQFASESSLDLDVGRAAVAAGIKEDETSSFARRIMTGQAAEKFFENNFRNTVRFKDCSLQKTTDLGCGFDFKLTPPQEDFLAVEVKGLRGPSGQIQLTEKEYKMAHYLTSRFYLYVVTDFAHKPKAKVFENPLNAGIPFEARAIKSEQRVWIAQIAV